MQPPGHWQSPKRERLSQYRQSQQFTGKGLSIDAQAFAFL
jgi:hypothetical protein